MNDNTPTRPRGRPISVSSSSASRTDKPVECPFCQEPEPLVDAKIASLPVRPFGMIQSYYVVCATCGAEGEKCATYDLALDRWAEVGGLTMKH